jgi:cyclopropane fatty-acyl-phospholipid synthase-like methyltransferase
MHETSREISLDLSSKEANIKKNRTLWDDENVWVDGGNEWSGRFGSTEKLYKAILEKYISRYCFGPGLEIAPGYGRITQYLLKYTTQLSVVDVSPSCLKHCENKFSNRIKRYEINDGNSLDVFPRDYFNFVFSFDSFVHMHKEVVFAYFSNMRKILKVGGCCVIHHSCLSGGSEDFSKNLAGRMNLDLKELNDFLQSEDFELISQDSVSISEIYESFQDSITVCRLMHK